MDLHPKLREKELRKQTAQKKPKRPVPEQKVKEKTRREPEHYAERLFCEHCEQEFTYVYTPVPGGGSYNERQLHEGYLCTNCLTAKHQNNPCCTNCATVCVKCESRFCPRCVEETKDIEFPCVTHRHCTDCKVRPSNCTVYPVYQDVDWVPPPYKLTWRSRKDLEDFKRWRTTEWYYRDCGF